MHFEVEPGAIYSALFPFSDLSATKKRPVLALGGVDETGDVRVAFITTTPVPVSQGYALSQEDYDGVPLPFVSHLRADKTFNLHASRLEKPLAKLSGTGYERALRKLITLDIPQFAAHRHAPQPFSPGKSVIPPSTKSGSTTSPPRSNSFWG